MYLSKLEIVGFKSFAQKINFRFNSGISAIVGPNGCGKSNIVDAIRWVLGEQKTSVLRSDVMENVIFNGSSTRKPLGMAEVTLTIENSKNILPSEYTEVTISRRLFRDGDSRYMMNKSSCRLRDIQDLFMDTGMGSDSYSVIELKMVEAILSGRLEERRHLFEEAAGVNKYKIRRKEADKKLVSVQSDLIRVEDIVREVQKNVTSLSRQASRTRKHINLTAELSAIEIELIKHEFFAIKKELDSLEGEIENLKGLKDREEESQKEAESALIILNTRRSGLDGEYEKANEKSREITSLLAAKKQDMAVSSERLTSLANDTNRITREIEEGKASYDKSVAALESARGKSGELEIKKAGSERELDAAKASRDEAASHVKNLRSIADLAHEKVFSIQNSISSFKSGQKRNETRKTALSQKIASTNSDMGKINEQISRLGSEQKDSEEKRDLLLNKLEEAEETQRQARARHSNLETNIRELQQTLTDKKNNLSQKKASLEFLNNLVDTQASSKFLMSTAEWKTGGEKVLLAEAIGADENFRTAIAAALGDSARYFIVQNKEEAFSAFEALRKNKKGKAVFISRDDVPSIPAPPELKVEEGIYGWLSEIARVDDTVRNVLRGVAGNTAIVEDQDKAREILAGGVAECAVTLGGEYIRKNWILRGGSPSDDEGATVGKVERTKQIKKEINRLNEEIEELTNELANNKKEFESIDLRSLNENVRKAESEKNSNERRADELSHKQNLLEENLVMLMNNLDSFNAELEEITKEDAGSEEELEKINEALSIAEEEFADARENLGNSEEVHKTLDEAARTAEMEDVRLSADIRVVEKEIRDYEDRIARYDETQDRRQKELERIRLESEKLTDYIENLKQENEDLEIKASESKNESEFIHQQIMLLQEQIDQDTELLAKQRRSIEKQLENIYSRELTAGEIRSRIRGLKMRATSEFQMDLAGDQYVEPEGFDLEAKKSEAQAIRENLKALGMVNFMAPEEFDEQQRRLEFYTKQVKDLVDSEKTLRETITEINRTAEEKFLTTYNQIRDNFRKLFVTLFNKDAEADLKLGEGNVLESDIEIIAKPPGKRPHSIEMISSGEKTLTAIALLFAIYLVKPSPFCILDEVDAPLDDANLDRFLDLIREFSKNTQFMIVTHNKKTMEAANTLYGITMQEEGVSKVVSVRLAQEQIDGILEN